MSALGAVLALNGMVDAIYRRWLKAAAKTTKWERSCEGNVDERGGRFYITATYNHSTRPQGYCLVDRLTHRETKHQTQASAKREAETRRMEEQGMPFLVYRDADPEYQRLLADCVKAGDVELQPGYELVDGRVIKTT